MRKPVTKPPEWHSKKYRPCKRHQCTRSPGRALGASNPDTGTGGAPSTGGTGGAASTCGAGGAAGTGGAGGVACTDGTGAAGNATDLAFALGLGLAFPLAPAARGKRPRRNCARCLLAVRANCSTRLLSKDAIAVVVTVNFIESLSDSLGRLLTTLARLEHTSQFL